VTNYRVRLEGPADVVLRVATELAEADGVELTSSDKPVNLDEGKVALAVTVEGQFDAVADAIAGIRGGLPSTASIGLTDG